MSKSIVLYLHVHQPFRVGEYSIFDAGRNHNYFDSAYESDTSNERIMRKVAEKSYLPTNNRLIKLLHDFPDFCLSMSISGVALEQMQLWAPDVLDSFKELISTGRVELVGETYHHSLAFFNDRQEFENQVRNHEEILQSFFNKKPTAFRNTELAYNNDLAYWADQAGYKVILSEGWDPILGWRSPNFVYKPSFTERGIKLLMKNYRLSDDIAFRFGDSNWQGWPLTADKFVHWLDESGDATNFNLFMDYETFGEHQWHDSGIFDFLDHLPQQWLSRANHDFKTVTDVAISNDSVDYVDMPHIVTWADAERDLSAWTGNSMQQSALDAIYSLKDAVLSSNNPKLIEDWRRLQTSDHFYYMCTKWFNDGDIHAYFSPYETPYQAYITYMNAWHDLRLRAGSYLMARTVMLGNGSLTVGLDENGLVHDFYYPYVGLDNLTTSRGAHHKIGVWIDGNFSWVDGDQWVNSIDSESDAMVSKIIMQNKDHGIELIFNDYVDHSTNAFVRRINVINQTEHHKSVRIFMHQIFQISRAGRADTALYVPDDGYILDYKGRCCLLISGKTESGQVFDQFAIGNYGIEGKEGTYKDAEDGELSGSPVEHGGVDSVIRFSFELNANEHTYLNYWVIAADSEYQAAKHHDKLVEQDLNDRLEANRKYWHEWLASASNLLHEVDKKYLDMTKKSLLVIKAHIDKRGGIIASCDSSIYNYGRDYYSYVWPRDGAYAIWPLIRLGYKSEAKKFFEFCRDILTEEGYLMHKYQPDRAIGSTWHPLLHGRRKELAIQEDETAGVLYMLGEYHKYSNDDEFVQSLYETFIKPAANFIVDFTDKETSLPHASYDLWEEKFLCTTYSTAVSYQALLVAAEFAEKFEYPDDALRWEEKAEEILDNSDVFFNQNEGYFRERFLLKEDGSLEFDNTLDVSSFYGVMVYGLYKDSLQIKSTEENLEKILLNVSPSGGSARYIGDNYFKVNDSYPGNPWIITTLWFAQYYARTKQPDKAREILDWTMSVTLSSGVLPEQINPDTKAPVSVTPLVWSHAEFINTVLDLTQIAE